MPTLPATSFPFCGPTYQAVSPVIDAQRSINLYPETAMEPGAKTQVALVGTPGLSLYGTLANGPVRALWSQNGKLFAVGGTHVYQIQVGTYGVIQDFGAIPGSTGDGYCKFVYCGTNLFVLDTSPNALFYVNPSGGYTNVFGCYDVEYMDGFLFALATGATNQVNVSDTTGSTWNALAFIVRNGATDLVNGLAQINGQMWILGEHNNEVWYDAGNPVFPLQRIQGATINQGAYNFFGFAAWSVVKADNTIYWFGLDERGGGAFWRAAGMAPQRISAPGIDALVASYGAWSNVRGFAYSEGGHTFIVWNFPAANSNAGATVVYDSTTGLWHERAYLSGTTLQRGRADCFASVNNGPGSEQNYVGDYANGNIYIQSLANTSDNGATIKRVRTAPHVSNSNRWMAYKSLMLDADIGTAQPVLSYSNDGGRSFPLGPYNMPLAGTAAATGINTYRQAQLGRSRDRVFQLSITDSANPIRIAGAYLNVIEGAED